VHSVAAVNIANALEAQAVETLPAGRLGGRERLAKLFGLAFPRWSTKRKRFAAVAQQRTAEILLTQAVKKCVELARN